MELSSEQRRHCRDVFEACNEFDSNDQLRDLMVASSLKSFRSEVEASTKSERITRCIARLSDKTWNGQEVFLYFIYELRQQYREGDGRRQALDRLYAELQKISNDTIITSPLPTKPLLDVSSVSQPPGRAVIKIFYSHATTSRDQGMLEEFLKHTAFMRTAGCINEWHQAMLMAGTPSEHERMQRLRVSDIVVVMLSPDYISTPMLLSESEQALASGARVVPVLLRPVHWQSLKIGQLEPLPRSRVPISKSTDRDSAFAEVVDELYRVVKNLLFR